MARKAQFEKMHWQCKGCYTYKCDFYSPYDAQSWERTQNGKKWNIIEAKDMNTIPIICPLTNICYDAKRVTPNITERKPAWKRNKP